MNRFISKQIHLFLRRVGYQIVPANSFLHSQDVVKLLVSRDVKVRNIFDVGAHRGEWTLAISKYLNQDIKVTMFEPSPHHKANLDAIANQFGYRYLPIALGKSKSLIDFYSTGGTGDSFYEEIAQQNKSRIVPVSIEVETLDNIIDNSSLVPPDLLKLDCQGSELDILKGGEKALDKVSGIILEASILECNKGAPLMGEIVSYLDEKGFFPFSLSEVHNRSGVLNQLDLVFLKKSLIH